MLGEVIYKTGGIAGARPEESDSTRVVVIYRTRRVLGEVIYKTGLVEGRSYRMPGRPPVAGRAVRSAPCAGWLTRDRRNLMLLLRFFFSAFLSAGGRSGCSDRLTGGRGRSDSDGRTDSVQAAAAGTAARTGRKLEPSFARWPAERTEGRRPGAAERCSSLQVRRSRACRLAVLPWPCPRAAGTWRPRLLLCCAGGTRTAGRVAAGPKGQRAIPADLQLSPPTSGHGRQAGAVAFVSVVFDRCSPGRASGRPRCDCSGPERR